MILCKLGLKDVALGIFIHGPSYPVTQPLIIAFLPNKTNIQIQSEWLIEKKKKCQKDFIILFLQL